jgi:hypothetical protein
MKAAVLERRPGHLVSVVPYSEAPLLCDERVYTRGQTDPEDSLPAMLAPLCYGTSRPGVVAKSLTLWLPAKYPAGGVRAPPQGACNRHGCRGRGKSRQN